MNTHPKPQEEQQESKSSAEMWAFTLPWDAMQILSDMAETAPNAYIVWNLNYVEHLSKKNSDKKLELLWRNHNK